MTTLLWSSSCNPDQSIEPFASALDKDISSKGHVVDDYMAIADSYHLTTCPHISSYPDNTDENAEVIRLANAELDLSNWRALLLASSVIGSRVSEIYLHNCILSPQHITDLATCLSKVGTIKRLKMQYIDFRLNEDNEAKLADAFKSLMNDTTGLTYITVSNCNLQDSIGQAIATGLGSNFLLTGINLSFNNFSDETFTQIISSVRFSSNIKAICLRGNKLEGGALITFLEQCLGAECGPSDDTVLKANAKLLADKNKAIKDSNKKRKKAGYIELQEIPALSEVVRKVGGKNIIVNQSLMCLDLMENSMSSLTVDPIIQILSTCDQELLNSFSLQLKLSSSVLNDITKAQLINFEKVFKLL